MHPKNIAIRDYAFDLPDHRIAFNPLEERDLSRLLVYRSGNITEDRFYNIDQHIESGSLLVFNNTRVIEARILFQKSTGGIVEIFCLEPDDSYRDITTAMKQQGSVLWKCLVGGASKWKRGQVLEQHAEREGKQITIRARYVEKRSDHFLIELSWTPQSESFAEILHFVGNTPLPPYIKRAPVGEDADRYQTIYAKNDGSVAAPTAGLHFTTRIFEKLRSRNIESEYVTLHVGAGTFKPVKSETMEMHDMHAEFIEISSDTIQRIIANAGRPVIAVGTTSLRTLESMYWLGVKAIEGGNPADGLSQWEPYEPRMKYVKTTDSLHALLHWMEQNGLAKLLTKTKIIIAPGYEVKCVDGLITNFHQPGSTLLLLVAALVGAEWRKMYDYALSNDFRFLSYGDANLIRIQKH